MRMNSSQSAASGPCRSSGRSFRSRAARATSNRPMERSVPFTVKRPSVNATSAGSVSSTWPAIFVAFWITASDALPMTTPPIRIERAECEPPPIGTISVSPWISLIAVHIDAEPFADALREARLVALAAGQRADRHFDAALPASHRPLTIRAASRW